MVTDRETLRRTMDEPARKSALIGMCKWHKESGYELRVLVCQDVEATMAEKLQGGTLKDFGIVGDECVFGTVDRLHDENQKVHLYEQAELVHQYQNGFNELWRFAGGVLVSDPNELLQLLALHTRVSLAADAAVILLALTRPASTVIPATGANP